MPTVFTWKNARIFLHRNDHPPPHVHAWAAGKSARFELGCPDGPVESMDSSGFRRNEILAIKREITVRLDVLCRMWSTMHG